MAQSVLTRQEAEAGELPPICMQCGEAATSTLRRRFSTDQVHLSPPIVEADPIGCLLFPLWMLVAALKFASWAGAVTMTVPIPVCSKHAKRWFGGLKIRAASITTESITLDEVSEKFANVWNARSRPESSPPAPIKIRCRTCRALNDESARFCSQCGAST